MILVLSAIIVAWFVCESNHARVSSADEIDSYLEYRRQLPTPIFARRGERNGSEFYAFFGPVETPFAFPSGPPVYIFDVGGNLKDWALDSGDTTKFSSSWGVRDWDLVDIERMSSILTGAK